MHVLDEKSRKLVPKSEKSILVGYADEQKGYISVITPKSNKLM